MYRFLGAIVLAVGLTAGPAVAQLSDADLAALEARGQAEGWTFTVGRNPATERPVEELCGLVEPQGWRDGAPFADFAAKDAVPAAFNWRDAVGCPPIRDQGGCGSCWAFGTTGPFECVIYIKDGVSVDLSEQWLISCNQETSRPVLPPDDPLFSWGCNGGWFAHAYHQGTKTDACGGGGAVLEADFPYVQSKVPCGCPYPHPYHLRSWAFIGPELGVADTNAIKQAILTHGPVSAAVHADVSFMGYRNGIFNNNVNQPPNHAVTLVGWDDTLGTNGVWILRNSWTRYWGENGYMRIEYGCSNVGFGACYVDYAGQTPQSGPTITSQPVDARVFEGFPYAFFVEATGLGHLRYAWEHDGQPVGTDAPVCFIENVEMTDAGTYVCLVTDLWGTTASRGAAMTVLSSEGLPAGTLTALCLTVAALGVCFAVRRR